MKYKSFYTLLILLISTNIFAKSTDQKKAINGIIDLTEININNAKIIKLQGKWEFYWKQLLTPNDFNDTINNNTPHYFKLPKSWSSYKINNKKIPAKGYATYRLIIKKQADTKETIYGLKISSVFSNYKLWVNNKLVNSVGTVSNNINESEPKFYYQDIPFVLDPTEENTKEIEIIIQVSNFSHQRAGLQKPIFFSNYENISHVTRTKDILNLIIIGIILVISIIHFNIYIFRKKDISNLYFSLLSLVMILRNISTGDRIITYIFPNINWEILVKLDNFSAYGTIPLFTFFIYSLFKDDFPKIMKNVLIGLGIIITIFVFTTPAITYGKLRIFYEIYILLGGLYLTFGILLVAAIRKRETAILSFLAFFILYATAINDVLSSMGLIQSAYVAPYGLVIFMFLQSISITSKSAKAINQNEELSEQLSYEKDNLEKNIEKRTSELKIQHQELIQHQENEKKQNWINTGMASINEILSANKNNINNLSKKLISAIIKYTNANIGAIYLLNSSEEKPYLELIADYGYDKETKEDKSKFGTSIGLVGSTFSTNKITHINNIPDDYIKINSGLGTAKPKSLLIIPLNIDKKVLGVIELASFNDFTEIELNFIKKIAQNISIDINNVKMNEYNVNMLKKVEKQNQVMKDKELEMKNNLEEMEYYREQYEILKNSN
ncbi:MAG: 7TM diverse intracellular signaling domain-containing protein [Bacteroidota bacterium]|nr:7TM diverse intracellular signaling domain-containing protein [Bacteroidota bacterium]